jgi:hypothetical protein
MHAWITPNTPNVFWPYNQGHNKEPRVRLNSWMVWRIGFGRKRSEGDHLHPTRSKIVMTFSSLISERWSFTSNNPVRVDFYILFASKVRYQPNSRYRLMSASHDYWLTFWSVYSVLRVHSFANMHSHLCCAPCQDFIARLLVIERPSGQSWPSTVTLLFHGATAKFWKKYRKILWEMLRYFYDIWEL